eukprot:2137552-Ditylum_brightwellii.AAC.1
MKTFSRQRNSCAQRQQRVIMLQVWLRRAAQQKELNYQGSLHQTELDQQGKLHKNAAVKIINAETKSSVTMERVHRTFQRAGVE